MENKKEKAIIVDIDGTIADCRHRRKFLDETPPDWKSFNESCVTDTPNLWCKEIINRFAVDHIIILVSGRAEEYREVTQEWLEKNGFRFDFLFMRKDGDFTADEIIKDEIYQNYIEPNYEVLFVLDDRAKVVKMWRNLGLTCLHCDEGNY